MSKIIVALDFATIKPLRELVAQLSPTLCRLKIGNILFTRYGPALIEELMEQGFDVFLDLKYHDIPQTVAGACRSAAELGVWMVNLHVVGGMTMMQAAREMVDQFSNKPLLIGVTILTSLVKQDITAVGMQGTVADNVDALAGMAQRAGLDGVVCSSQEVKGLRARLGKQFILVTPGIRLKTDSLGDQKRVMTPADALAAGSSYLVIGRPITQAVDPLAVLASISSD